MKTGRIKHRFYWLATLLTLSINVFSSQASCLAEFRDDSGLEAIAKPQGKSLVDPYWKYYHDCDRWGIEFSEFNLATTRNSISKPPSAEQVQLPRFARTSPFQTVKFTKPKRKGGIGVASDQRAPRISHFRLSMLSLKRSVRRSIEQQLVPFVQFLEFVSVESATYEEYYLQPVQFSAQRRLKQIWSWTKSETGLDAATENLISKRYLGIQRLRCLLSKLLQKSTAVF